MPSPHNSRLVSVAVPVPALDLLTYQVPAEWETPAVGARVLVPVGTRTLTGCVVGDADAPGDHVKVRMLADVLDDRAFLPPDVVRLALWVAEYYVSPPGEAIATAMPPRAWVESERRVRITPAGIEAAPRERGARRRILHQLLDNKPAPLARLARKLATGSSEHAPRGMHAVANGLAADGLVQMDQALIGRAEAFKTEKIAAITAQGLGFSAREERDTLRRNEKRGQSLLLGDRQREALEALRGSPEGLTFAALGDRGIDSDTLKRLAVRGLLSISSRRVDRDPFETVVIPVGPGATLTLTVEQQVAYDTLLTRLAARKFHPALLHGVTGSGKTEIYLRLAMACQKGGRSVLMLVPEIALTPAVAARFRAAFGERVAIQHSALSDGERHDQWHRIRNGQVDVVVGTRSAVFAPLAHIGLIVVDEEHDGSYKQEDTPRYHGRDVAVMRARESGALIVLGSATPSLESYYNTMNGRYEKVVLTRRVLDRPLASVRIVDMRDEYATEGPDIILSRTLTQALQETLDRGEQAIVLLNRRGYAAGVFCRQCGGTAECPNCSVSLTVHLQSRRARCHYCNYSLSVPKTCPKCAAPYLDYIGYGTERVEHEINRLFPTARVERLDRDTVRRRGAITAMLARFASGDVDVLVGTQMIAKGHDFPRVTLVGVISADVGLGLADFRAAERTFQLLTQVAGRAGRGEARGIAVVQTLFPKHYSIRHACRQDYDAFVEEELRYRHAMRYPPVVALIDTIVRGTTVTDAMTIANDLARRIRSGPHDVRVLGPAPAPLSRLRGEHRVQFFLKGTNRKVLRTSLVAAIEASPDAKRQIAVDVDPLSVL